MRVRNGRLEIPYKNGWIKVYAVDKIISPELLQLLEHKCGIKYPMEEIDDMIRETSIGWSLIWLFGISTMVVGTYIMLVCYINEGYFTLERTIYYLFSPTNFLGVAGLYFVGVGFVLKVIYWFSAHKYFRPYKEYFKVTL